MIRIVQASNSFWIVVCKAASVSGSIDAVASSKISTYNIIKDLHDGFHVTLKFMREVSRLLSLVPLYLAVLQQSSC